MNKHTPGPWEWNGQVKASKVLIHSDNAPIIEGSAYENMWLASGSDETDAANLRLIAAAPELLESLNRLLDCISETRGKDATDAVAKARAVIAKGDGHAMASTTKTPPPPPA